MQLAQATVTISLVDTTYAVVWREGDDPVGSGRLEVRPRDVVLDGAVDGEAVLRTIPLAGLQSIRVGRARGPPVQSSEPRARAAHGQ